MNPENKTQELNTSDFKPVQLKKSVMSSKKGYQTLWIVLFVGLLLTLPVHYAPEYGKVFLKETRSFKNTIITEEDVDRIITEYNHTKSLAGRAALASSPLCRTLREQGIIADQED